MNDDVVIPLFAIGLPALIACAVMAFRFGAARREMTHRERMRALELGQPLPGGPPGAAPACAAIGAGVPIAACLFAMIATLETRGDDLAVGFWFVAMIVSLAALFTAYRLALRLFFPNGETDRYSNMQHGAHDKQTSDPDLYDVVSRRG